MTEKERKRLDELTKIRPFINARLQSIYDKDKYNLVYFNYDQIEMEFMKGHDHFYIMNGTLVSTKKIKSDDEYYELFNKLMLEMAKRNHYIMMTYPGISTGLTKYIKMSNSQAIIDEV